jgi:hypothetical protein
MQHFVFTFSRVQAVFVALVIIEFAHYGRAGIVSTDRMVFNVDLVRFTLVNQLIVLSIANLPFFSGFEFLPGLFFHHSGVSVIILSFQFKFFKSLSQTSFFFSLCDFLFVDVRVSF